jgi:hypothetical protein
MRNQAESLHIFDQGVQSFMDTPRISTDRIEDTLHIFATRTEESRTQTAHIDPHTGHVIDPDEAAAQCAAGPDQADPPEGNGGGGGVDTPSVQEAAEVVVAVAAEEEEEEEAEEAIQEQEEDTMVKINCSASIRTRSLEIAQKRESF